MKIHAIPNRLWLLASGLVFLSSQAFALEINNNTGYPLNVTVTCGAQNDSFEVSPNQVGDCPSDVCIANLTCKYEIEAEGDGSCSGKVNSGNSVQVGISGDGISCKESGS